MTEEEDLFVVSMIDGDYGGRLKVQSSQIQIAVHGGGLRRWIVQCRPPPFRSGLV
jgi:hypothetical protein